VIPFFNLKIFKFITYAKFVANIVLNQAAYKENNYKTFNIRIIHVRCHFSEPKMKKTDRRLKKFEVKTFNKFCFVSVDIVMSIFVVDLI